MDYMGHPGLDEQGGLLGWQFGVHFLSLHPGWAHPSRTNAMWKQRRTKMEGQGRRYSLSLLCYATHHLYMFTTQFFPYSCCFTWKLLGGVDDKYWLFYPAAIREMSSNTSFHKIGMSALMSLSPPQICWAGQILIFLASLNFWAGNNN